MPVTLLFAMGSYVTKTRAGWLDQAQRAQARLDTARQEAALPDETPLIALAAVDYEAFCLLVEALHALGQPLAPELLDRAQMRPVDELFGV